MRNVTLSLSLFSLLAVSCGSDGENVEPSSDASIPTADAGIPDAAVTDVGADVASDVSIGDADTDATPDGGAELMCPEGRINLDRDDGNGCESPDFPAYHDEACEPCWGLPNAIAGCNKGTCQIVACTNKTADRDGDPMNGCEATCAVGECLQVGVSVQKDFITAGDITLGRGVATLRWNGTTDTLSYVFPNGTKRASSPTVTSRVVLPDNRVVGVADGKLKISDDLGLTYYDGALPQGYTAKFIAQGPSGGVMLAGTESDTSLHLLRSDDYITWTVDRALTVQDPYSFFVTPSSIFIDDRVSTDGGATWTNTYIRVLPPKDVAESANGTIVMAAADILVSQDKGLTWTSYPLTNPQRVKWVGPDAVIVAGENAIAYSGDNGATWQTRSVEGVVKHVVELANGDLRAFTTTGGIYESTTKGQEWTQRRAGGFVPPFSMFVGDQAVIGEAKELAAAGREFSGPWVKQWNNVNFPLTKVDQMGGGVSVLLGDYFAFGNDVTSLVPLRLDPASISGCSWCGPTTMVNQTMTATYNGVTAFHYRTIDYGYAVYNEPYRSFVLKEFRRNTGSGWTATTEDNPPNDMIPTPLGFLTMDGRYSNDQGVTVQSFNAPGCMPTSSGLTAAFANGDVLAIAGDVCVGTNGGENWSSILPVAGITSRAGATPERLAILNVNQQEWAFVTMTDGQEQVLLRSGDRGQTWAELVAVPSNATMSGGGSRMGIVVPRDTTLYYESPNP
ncbi:MAG: sialidase family protein [bacterium]